MKRNILLGVVLTLCTAFLASAAFGQTFTQVWKVSAGTWPMMSTGDNSRGAALDTSTGHYLVTRRDIPRIYVFNASNGTLLDSLKMASNTDTVKGGTVALQDIEVTSDGVIYGSNLIIGGPSDTTFKIYRWANDNSATVPTVAFSGRVSLKSSGPRLGDAFDVAGSGTGTVIYVGGNATTTDTVQVFTTTDGTNFTRSRGIKITAQDAGAGIAQITAGGDFYASKFSTGSPIWLYSGTGAGRLEAVPTSVAGPQGDLAYLEAAGRKWIAAAPESASAGGHARLLNISYGLAGAVRVGETPDLGTNTNTNASGDVELKYNSADTTITLYVLVDNNGIAAYKTGNLLAANVAPYVKSVWRGPYIPQASQADTVYATILDDNGIAAATLHYSVNGGADSLVAMTRSSGDSLNGSYWAVIPASVNKDTARISYKVETHDISGDTVWSSVAGYFAGTTPLSIYGPRAVDANGVLLYKGYGIRVRGVCTLEDSVTYNYQLDVIVQDLVGATDVFQGSSAGGISTNFVRGNQYVIEGAIGQYNGKLEVTTQADMPHLKITDNGPGVLPLPKLVTLHDLAWGILGEQLENSLVRVAHLRLTPSSNPWPQPGATGTALNLTVTDNGGVDSLTFRTSGASLLGLNPREPFTVTGIANQFDGTNPYTAGYQIIGRDQNDVASEVMIAMPDTTVVKGLANPVVQIPVMLVDSADGLNITAFQFRVMWDTTKLLYAGSSVAKTLSDGYLLADNVMSPGKGMVAASGTKPLTGKGTLFNLMFRFRAPGASTVAVDGQFNEGNPLAGPASSVVIASLPKWVTVAEARKDLNNDLIPDYSLTHDTLLISGVVTSPNFVTSAGGTSYYVQDSTAGIDVFKSGTVMSFSIGDSVFAIGTISQYKGATELSLLAADAAHCGFLKKGTKVQPKVIPFSEFVTNAEHYEGSLVKIDTLYKSSGTWPAALSNGSLYMKKATGADSINIFIDADASVAGSKEPKYPVNITGVVSQYASSGVTGGYELLPRDSTDFVPVIVVGVVTNPNDIPKDFYISQNYPNPFNPTTMINFGLPKEADVQITVYNILGQKAAVLVDGMMKAGNHQVMFNGARFSSGVYFYVMRAGDKVFKEKMLLLK
ncbi:MAG: T9SS type A sorting domain-containing protein [Bacteroidota bacterium]|nr:T9SS type A sorting domain-containing protein [Bacteroidota bacterium]